VFRRRGNTGEGWELSFLGQGHVLVQPSEMLPPQNASLSGVRGHYGVGQNQGNAWE
ncbi:AIM24 family protein, partial [Streptomyces sp. SID11233]|nr:AIM24 family protein [Streptomyces sp. SID11233]